MKRIRVLLADDHLMFLAGLKKLLESEFEVVGAVEDGRSLVEAAKQLQPDLIVADISMPSLNGIDAVMRLKEEGLNAKVIFLTMHGDSLFVREALRAGVAGYILKRDAPDRLVTAIREVMHGKTFLSTDALTGVIRKPGAQRLDTAFGSLTSRQREVLQLLAEGRSSKEIAWTIHVSTRTVEFHKYQLMKRLGVHNTAELTGIAIKHGLISP